MARRACAALTMGELRGRVNGRQAGGRDNRAGYSAGRTSCSAPAAGGKKQTVASKEISEAECTRRRGQASVEVKRAGVSHNVGHTR